MIFTSPSDTGFGCTSRQRAHTIFLKSDCGKFIKDPQLVYDELCAGMGWTQLHMEDVLSLASPEKLGQELDRMRDLRLTPTGLTEFEAKNIQGYESALDSRGDPVDTQVFAINQNPEVCFKASRLGCFPAFTATDKYLWVRAKNAPLLASQKFIAHGYPMTKELATALGVPAT